MSDGFKRSFPTADGFARVAAFYTNYPILLRALDAFEATMDPRVFADFQETLPHPHNPRKVPMGLQQLRDKFNAQAYAGELTWIDDIQCIFARFDEDPPESVRKRMADAGLGMSIGKIGVELFPRSAFFPWKLKKNQTEAKQLEADYIADKEVRAATATCAHQPAAAASAAPASIAPLATNQPAAAAASLVGSVAPRSQLEHRKRPRTIYVAEHSCPIHWPVLDETLYRTLLEGRPRPTECTCTPVQLDEEESDSEEQSAISSSDDSDDSEDSDSSSSSAVAASTSAEQAAAAAASSASKPEPVAFRSDDAKQRVHKTSGDNLLATIVPSPRYAKQLERDKAQLNKDKELQQQLVKQAEVFQAAQADAEQARQALKSQTQLTQQLKQDKKRMQQQLNVCAEKAAKVAQAQTELRQKEVELVEARRLLVKAEAAAAEQTEQSRLKLESVQQQLVQNEDKLKQQTAAAADEAAEAKRQSEAQTKVIQQLQRDKAQAEQEIRRLRQSNAQLVQAKAQVDRKEAQLQRQLDERTAELSTTQSHAAAASAQVTVKLEKLVDAQVDKHEEAAGKRKAIEEREGEAKRRRSAEAARDELAERNKQLQSALLVNPAARPDCSSCFEHPTSAVCLPCGHLVSCIECAEQWQTAKHTCPVCRHKVTKVVQTYLASGSD
jgi:hypothetical protein